MRKLEHFSQDGPRCLQPLGALCKANQGLMEFVEMSSKHRSRYSHPLLTATQEGNFNGT
ncbi:hypothetical protein OK016_02900 [Vibrio chagasii]|nr:hypothetical protein [Vibrio chagasii]